jgi:ketosteroid isomerase-like protein
VTVQELTDRLELRALVDAYASALDRRDIDAFVALFTADAHLGIYEPGVEIPASRFDGTAELASLMSMLEVYGETMHVMANHTVTFDGEQANGEVYCLAHHLTDGATRNLAMTIRYRDRYERTQDGWRIAHRRIIRYWNERRPVLSERLAF